MTTVPYRIETDVSQYAADYYELPSSGTYNLVFEGETETPLLPAEAPSGEQVWYASRTNFANPRLTRSVDLRDVTGATLEYTAYVDIEQGYDFAYVSVSEDGGTTWEPLAAEGMQGLDGVDDPRSRLWLTVFTRVAYRSGYRKLLICRPMQARSLTCAEYITDPILTYGGFAIDNIAIPELVLPTTRKGTLAAGQPKFARVPLTITQSWQLWLITFPMTPCKWKG
ncbi:MAG: immune inhibitor A [Chloroflexota bacterium]